MNVGFIGLGKLGLPCALAVESKGHSVMGYDPSPSVQEVVKTKRLPYKEIWAQKHLDTSKIEVKSVDNVVNDSEIIFVAVQTPHNDLYEGVTRLPEERVDFDYTYLRLALSSLSQAIEKQSEDKVVIIISTVLPGTIEREIRPLLGSKTKLCYNPFFIAMGTTMKDFMNPEFVLFGVDDEKAVSKARELYETIHNSPFFETSIESAELIKVAYNTFISMKICYINTMMEICHKTKANIDEVTDALSLGTERIISPKYLMGGMGDGGGCHPRDNIALSWLSRELGLSYDFFEGLMKSREKQTEWFIDLIQKEWDEKPRPIKILGKCFKKETNLTVGSPSILLKNMLCENGYQAEMWDPHVDNYEGCFTKSIFFIGTNHEYWKTYKFPEGSTVIDPWRMILDQDGVKVVRVGE